MRFLGTWFGSLVALGLVAALVLGRDVPPRVYELAAIEAAFEDRYAAALADLEAGAVLYLRTELRTPGSDEPARVSETWVGTDSRGTAVARIEGSFLGSPVFQVSETRGARQAILDLQTGAETDVTVGVVPAEPPEAILRRVRQSALGLASVTGEGTEVSPIVADRTSVRIEAQLSSGREVLIVLDDPLLHVTRTYDSLAGESSVTSEVAVVEWKVLAAGTPLGTRS